ncbi:MAG: ABC transporter ATP-binding protein [Actinomycetaceae bacterium]|nr:ABC transporter ATP-binding protein [Actinomycetaceae bacterium]
MNTAVKTKRTRPSLVGVVLDMLLVTSYRNVMDAQSQRQWYKGLTLAAVLGTLEGMALIAIIPTITSFTTGQSSLGLSWRGWLIFLAVVAVVGAVVTYLQQMYSYRGAMYGLQHLNIALGNKLARLPLGWFDGSTSGRLSRLTGAGMMSVGEGLAHFGGPIIRSVFTTLSMMVLAWFWSWQLALALTLAIPVVFTLGWLSQQLNRRSANLTHPAQEELATRIVEFAKTQPILRACGASHNYPPLQRAGEESYRTTVKGLWYGVAANMLGGVAAQGVTVVLMVLATSLGGSGALSPIATVAFVGISIRYSWVLADLSAMLIAAEIARRELRSVDEIMTSEELPLPNQDATLTAPGTVEFEDVQFGYEEANTVLERVSFRIPAGSFTAIVGPSGSGKTTIFRLLARFWDTTAGTVRVGGVDVRDQTTEQLMAQLSMVFQDVYLFDESLRHNIAVGRAGASDEEVVAAGELAGVGEIAARLPGGWDAPVGEGGRQLSGGERQRVSVARALLKRAPIVLFDEATSALDPENEQQVEAALEALRGQSTVMVIAHKLATIENADQIIVLGEDGRVNQVGTHEELLAAGGMYGKLWSARRRAQGWSLTETTGA